ncbi:DUF6194 family protein [Roseovarius sp. MS2]|uniref:DUF6194 family protein n=1 Tax=Roseovarius sp. MS2 TaxID=3390728 RepID=UPI003EDC841F
MSQTKWIEIETVHSFITNELDGVVPKDAWGETSYFYNPGHVFQRGTYFATIKQKDGANDRASHLDRSGVWRLNLGVSKEVFFGLFGPPPPRPGKGGVIDGGWDFAASDQLMPHPIYGWMSWINRLRTSLVNATSGLDVREARAGYADLASELNRTARESERLRAETIQVANAQEQATREAEQRTAALNRLRAAHDPLFANSQRYEQALREIQTLESAGALSARRAALAREQASQSLLAASAANTGYARTAQASTFHTANMAAQFNDIGVMLASGQSPLILAVQQGTQISQVLNQMGSRASVLSTLRAGFASMVSPVSLLTIGVIAGGAALIQWAAGALGASEETQSFSDALSAADSAISTLRSATDALAGGNLERLREQYGAVNLEFDAHLERLRRVAELEAGLANSALIDSIRGELTSDGNILTNDVDAVRRAFETTNDQARTLLSLMQDVKSARTFEEQADAVTRLRQAVESTTGGLDRAEGSAAGVLTQLVRSEDAALRLLAAQNGTTSATDNAAASSLAGQVGTAANEAARLLANLGSAPAALNAIGKSVQEQIGEIQAQNKSLNL